MVELKLGLRFFGLQNACSKGCFLTAFLISLLALIARAYAFPFAATYRDLFLKAPARAIIDLARSLRKKTGLLKST